MLPVLASYIIWIPSILGLGTMPFAVQHRMPRDSDPSHLLLAVVFGMATLGIAAILLNFFVAVTHHITVVLLFAGWGLFLLNRHILLQLASSTWSHSWLSLLIALLALLSWTALVSRQSILPYDTGLYHLQSIKWITQSRLPLGLANLHGRFGFNSSWFSVAAALELPLLASRSVFVVNGLLFATYGLATAAAMTRILAGDQYVSSVFLALTAIPWLSLASQGTLGSASPDLPVTLLGFVSVYLIIRSLESEPQEQRMLYVTMAFLVAAFAATVKLSVFPLILGPIVASVPILRKAHDRKHSTKRVVLASIAGGTVLLLPWALRGVMLSGYPPTRPLWLDYLVSAGPFHPHRSATRLAGS